MRVSTSERQTGEDTTTTLYPVTKTCAVWGTASEYIEIGSTSAFGAPDLNSRPPEMARSTIFAWVQRCPACGYCAADISQAPGHAGVTVRSIRYRAQLVDSTMPELANSFLRQAIVDERAGDYASAAWAIVHAAWVCNDEEKPEAAQECRGKAAEMVMRAIESGQEITEQRGAETAILVDLLRRAGRFAKARQVIASRRPGIIDDVILKILAFQELLIARGDVARYTLDEAVGAEA
ncbi:MAG: hypothetical protein RMJ48_12775 [Roseiflexaceae bacterium]|nr:hypothetical protein [Roseiflexaceae bacterium]